MAASIIEGYIVLGSLEFLNMHAQTLAKLLDLVIGNVNDKGLLSILPLVDVLVQVCLELKGLSSKALHDKAI